MHIEISLSMMLQFEQSLIKTAQRGTTAARRRDFETYIPGSYVMATEQNPYEKKRRVGLCLCLLQAGVYILHMSVAAASRASPSAGSTDCLHLTAANMVL